LTLTGLPGAPPAGQALPLTVAITDSFGNDAAYTGTIHFTSTDPLASLPGDYTFTTSDQSVHTFSITFRTAGTQGVTVLDVAGTLRNGRSVNVAAGAVVRFTVAGPTYEVAGWPFAVTLTAVDSQGNPVSNYAGTVHFTSSDGTAGLPVDYTFTGADGGSHTFSHLTLGQPGQQTITVASSSPGSPAATLSVSVYPSPASTLSASGFTSQLQAGQAATLTVSLTDPLGNTTGNYTGTIHFSSSDAQAGLPADYTFTVADGGVHTFTVSLRTLGYQTITVADTQISSLTDRVAATVLGSAVTHYQIKVASGATVGVPFGFTVTALDALGNPVVGYTGTIHFTSSDRGATLPADYTFTAADQGVHTFSKGATLRNLGKQSITAVDPSNASVAGVASVAVSRRDSSPFLVTGADQGGGPDVRVIDARTGAIKFDFLAYDPGFLGGVRVAIADVTGDGIPDIITAPGPGGGPDIRVWDGITGKLVREIMAYDPHMTSGVFVAAADLNGDGRADIITGPDQGGGPDIRIFDGASGALLREFLAYGSYFMGGVRLATGDLTGDGVPDLVTAPGPGGEADIHVYDGVSGRLVKEFLAYNQAFLGGVYVAVGAVTGDGQPDIITSPGAGGGPDVRIFRGSDLALIGEFLGAPGNFLGGVRISTEDINGDGKADIVAAGGAGSSPLVQSFDATNLGVVDHFFAYDPNFIGGVFIGGGS
jgi:hypothetical protein